MQWHERAIQPPEDCRSDIWFHHQLAKRLKTLYAGATDDPFLSLTWDFEEDEHGEARAVSILKEINGYTVADRVPVKSFAELKDDGSTVSGGWIYTGVYPEEGVNKAAARVADDWVSQGWASRGQPPPHPL